MFQGFQVCYGAAAQLLYALALTIFCAPFLGEGRRGRKAAVFLLYLAGWLICDGLALPQGSFGLLLAGLLLAGAGALGLERRLAFLLTLLYLNARISSGLMVESVYFILEELMPFPLEPLERVYLRAALLVSFFLLTHGVLMYAMLYLLRRLLARRRITLHRRELCYLGLVPAAGVLFGQVISKLLFEVEDGMLLQLYRRHPAFLWVIPLLALLFYAGACLTISFQQGMDRLVEERENYFVERQQSAALRERMEEMERSYGRVRQIKHELRGHLTNLQGLVRAERYGELEGYLARMGESVEAADLSVRTGNAVTDVVVGGVARQCEKLGIRFQAGLRCPEGGGYDAYDLGIILHNLLQNALEACERVPEGQRYISLTGRRSGRFLLLEVKNSCPGPVAFGPDGLPATTKKDPSVHGIGLANVRRAAERYMGELELKADQQEFSATVLLQERNNA